MSNPDTPASALKTLARSEIQDIAREEATLLLEEANERRRAAVRQAKAKSRIGHKSLSVLVPEGLYKRYSAVCSKAHVTLRDDLLNYITARANKKALARIPTKRKTKTPVKRRPAPKPSAE